MQIHSMEYRALWSSNAESMTEGRKTKGRMTKGWNLFRLFVPEPFERHQRTKKVGLRVATLIQWFVNIFEHAAWPRLPMSTQQLPEQQVFNSTRSSRPASVNHGLLMFSFKCWAHPECFRNFQLCEVHEYRSSNLQLNPCSLRCSEMQEKWKLVEKNTMEYWSS